MIHFCVYISTFLLRENGFQIAKKVSNHFAKITSEREV